MFRRVIKQQNPRPTDYDSSSHGAGSSEYPDTVNLPPTLGDIESLPVSFQTQVSSAFISQLRDQPRTAQRSNMLWLNPRLESAAQIASFTSFLGSCKTNEIVWVYARYYDMLFQTLYDAFVLQVEYLNSLPERFISPASRPIVDLLSPIEILYQMMLLLPRLMATGWCQEQIVNILIVLLDHGNNQDLRTLGQHLLTPYMLALGDKISPRILDLFENMIVIQAITVADMPAASHIVGDLFCAIGGGINITNIGCGQRAIIAFESGRPSICPVMQDRVCTANPQGISALSMLSHALGTIAYTANMIPSPRAAYAAYESHILQARTHVYPFKILSLEFTLPHIFNMPNSTGNCLHLVTPVLALSGPEVEASSIAYYRCFRNKYLSWMYPAAGEPAQTTDGYRRPVRRMPVHASYIFINFMLRCMIPIFEHMLPEGKFLMPTLRAQKERMVYQLYQSVSATSESSQPSTSKSDYEPGIPEANKASHHINYQFSATPESYAFMRNLMLDDSVESTDFFIDTLCLALCYPCELANRAQTSDHLDQDPGLAKISYEVALGALTVVRLWLVAHEEYQPMHLRPTRRDKQGLCRTLEAYVMRAHNIVMMLVDQGSWNDEKLVLMYNALLVYRAMIRTYFRVLPRSFIFDMLVRLQEIVESFLKRQPDTPSDVYDEDSAANQALTLMTECLVPSWIALDVTTESVQALVTQLYSIKTPWIFHMEVWGNVLRSMTISRGRELYQVDERMLIHESMFAGSRQRRGRRMVDAYMEQLLDATFHQSPGKFILEGAFDTSTPFHITSNLVWSTMRRIMSYLQKSARAAALNRDKSKMVHINVSDTSDGSTPHGPVDSPTPSQDVFTRVCYSGTGNLYEYGPNMATTLLSRIANGIESGILPHYDNMWLAAGIDALKKYINAAPSYSAKQTSYRRAEDPGPTPLTGSANESLPSHSLRRIVASLAKKKNPAPSIPHTDTSSSTKPAYKTSLQYRNLSSIDLVETSTVRTQSQSASERSVHSQRLVPPARDETTVHVSALSEDTGDQAAIRPAKLEHRPGNYQSTSQLAQMRTKVNIHTADVDLQKEEVVASNRRVAWNMMGNIIEVTWLLESLWVDVDIGTYFRLHTDPSESLKCAWVIWVNLLGSLDTHQILLIYLSPIAAGEPFDLQIVEIIVKNCSNIISSGIPGSKMLIYLIERAMHRLKDTYAGDPSDTTVEYACLLLMSIGTLLIKAIWDITRLLTIILSAAPGLITLKGVNKSEIQNPAAVRDFLVEKIFQRFAHPHTSSVAIPHLYNQHLVHYELIDGMVLRLEPALYRPSEMWKQHTQENKQQLAQERDKATKLLTMRSQLCDSLTSKDIFNCTDIPPSMREATLTPSAYQHWGRERKGSDPEDHKMFEEVESFIKEELRAISSVDENNDPARLISPVVDDVLHCYQELLRYHKGFDMGQAMKSVHVTLKMSDALIRDLRALDKIHFRETIKVAVFYVGIGQHDESQILSNTVHDTSDRYRQFVRSLGWYVDLATFEGFTGKMESDGSDGKVCLYFADEHVELVFHEASIMPLDPKDPRQTAKKRHIGNDHVHIVWNETHHRYRPETITGDFGNVQIQIRPLTDGLYGVNIYRDSHIDDVGPITSGMVVSADVLPHAVRCTAIKGHCVAKEAFFGSVDHPYIVRQNRINEIIEKHRVDGNMW
ncbi:hypothetical protein EC988_000758 [Linderina pennispora]|nr:hypothetical protein EC988_000758 [Linderina pennispora]